MFEFFADCFVFDPLDHIHLYNYYIGYKEKQHYQPPPQFGYDGYQNNHHGYQQGVPPQPGGPVRIVEQSPMTQQQQQQIGYNPVVRHQVEGSSHTESFALILSLVLCLIGSPCALCCTIPAYTYAKMVSP